MSRGRRAILPVRVEEGVVRFILRIQAHFRRGHGFLCGLCGQCDRNISAQCGAGVGVRSSTYSISARMPASPSKSPRRRLHPRPRLSPRISTHQNPLPQKCLAKRRGRSCSKAKTEPLNRSSINIPPRKSGRLALHGPPHSSFFLQISSFLHPSLPPRPAHSPTPVRVLTVHGAAGAKAISLQKINRACTAWLEARGLLEEWRRPMIFGRKASPQSGFAVTGRLSVEQAFD